MFTSGFSPPEIAELKVLISGMLASAWLTGTSLSAFQLGTAALNGSQLPCGSGISTAGSGLGSGSAYAVTASGIDAPIAAIAAAAPMALLVRVFTFGSSARQSLGMLCALIDHCQSQDQRKLMPQGC
jgi:hypothetical protein